MIDKDELLNNKDFYKSFKNGEELNSFFKQMHKRAVVRISVLTVPSISEY